MGIQTSYLRSVYEDGLFKRTVDKAIEEAKVLFDKHQFDTIAFSGMSGAAMAYVLAYQMNLQLICVRKGTDGSHFHRAWPFNQNGHVCEGNLDTKRYLIVDDFITSGNTLSYIVGSLLKEAPGAKCVAILMYAQSQSRNWQHPSWETPIELTSFLVDRVW